MWNRPFRKTFTFPYSAGGRFKDAHGRTVILATIKPESNTCVHLAILFSFGSIFVSCRCPGLGPHRGDQRAMFPGNVSIKCFRMRTPTGGRGAQGRLGASPVGKGISMNFIEIDAHRVFAHKSFAVKHFAEIMEKSFHRGFPLAAWIMVDGGFFFCIQNAS